MRLIHYSAEPFTLDRSRRYGPARLDGMKPAGLWLSCEGLKGSLTWRAWCEGEHFHLPGLAHRTLIKLRRGAPVLRISSPAELDGFHARYGKELYPGELASLARVGSIDWARFAELHAGLIIAPYLWARRLDGPLWYYGWDCASACIWQLSAIRSATPIP